MSAEGTISRTWWNAQRLKGAVRQFASVTCSDAGTGNLVIMVCSSVTDSVKPAPPDRLVEGLDAGDGAAEDQRMDVVRALVGVHDLEVHRVADHAEFVGDAVAAEHVARGACDVER